MYYGEANDCVLLESKAMDAFVSMLKLSKLERKSRNVIMLLEIIVEYNIGHPRIVEAIENHIIFNTHIDFIDDIVRFTTVGKQSEFFSERFYDAIFRTGIKLLPTRPSSETVKLIKVFADKKNYL